MSSRILAGVMSGTSADGVDVALTEITGRGMAMSARLIHHAARPYEPDLRRRIFVAKAEGHITLSALATLGREISLAYADAVNTAIRSTGLTPSRIAAIAAHGQTLYHAPPNTIQWLDPALVSAETRCRVISDFRRADCAAGGQGAPLVPFADYILFRHPQKHRVLLNIGGIANLTFIPAGASIDQVIAFDTGPGNCVLDHLMRKSGSSEGFDRDGVLSMRGQVHFPTALASTQRPYFFHKPPKSTDGPEMIGYFEDAVHQIGKPSTLEDLLATACFAAARAVRQACDLLPARPDELIVSGGGTSNPRLLQELHNAMVFSQADSVPPIQVPVGIIDDHGIPSCAKEALAFALLGAATLDGIPSNVPSATGAKQPVVLGSISPPPS